MSHVTIRCRQNGPFVVEGAVKIVDHLGNVFSISSDKPAIALCRCGHSGKKPFCDGSHRACNFLAEELAAPSIA